MTYLTRDVFPHKDYENRIEQSYSSNLIDTHVTGRSPTGWGIDHATECLSIGLGLEPGSLRTLILDNYRNPGTDYNPCLGLSEFISGNSVTTLESYSRYWHGHAVLSQWLIYFLGIGTFRLLLWVIMIGLCTLIFKELTIHLPIKAAHPRVFYFLLIAPFIVFGDGSDVHGSATHAMANIGCLLISWLYLRGRINQPGKSHHYLALILGSIYNFVLFMLSPQSIPVMLIIFTFIPLILFGKNFKDEGKKLTIFLFNFGFGYMTTWICKWILVSSMTQFNIWQNVSSQITHRTDQNPMALSDGVAIHLGFVNSAPVFIRSWVANLAAFGIHLADPRYASRPFIAMVLALIILAGIFFGRNLFLTRGIDIRLIRQSYFAFFIAACFLLFWYAILGQHSFDHATYTFRSIAILFGGFLALSSLHVKTKFLKFS